MPAPRKKGRPGKGASSPSALDSERSILLERQRQLDEKIAALNHTIKQATTPAHRMDITLTGAGAAASGRFSEKRRPPRKVVLRAERQEGRLQTIALVLTVLALLVWAAYKYL